MPVLQLPNFYVEKLPKLRIKSIHFKNFKVFNDYKFNFTSDGIINNFNCFIGPNGCGKSTLLSSLQLLFANFNGIEKDRLYLSLGKSIRHNGDYKDERLFNDDFLITAELVSEDKNYEVKINRNGFVQKHPKEIIDNVYRLCYFTRFDQELHNFQLNRNMWEKFKTLFEAVTGFTIKEQTDVFSMSDDPKQADLLNKYVLGFLVYKPKEIISHKECSDGERKIIKSFSTLLNLDYMPQIILIDNVEMHVESSRHLKLIQAMRSCYPDSQIFTTTHSYHISRNFSERNQVYDLRIIHAKPLTKAEPWRLFLKDEINDCIIKLNSCNVKPNDCKKIANNMISNSKEHEELINSANLLLGQCEEVIENISDFKEKISIFMSKVNVYYVEDLIS